MDLAGCSPGFSDDALELLVQPRFAMCQIDAFLIPSFCLRKTAKPFIDAAEHCIGRCHGRQSHADAAHAAAICHKLCSSKSCLRLSLSHRSFDDEESGIFRLPSNLCSSDLHRPCMRPCRKIESRCEVFFERLHDRRLFIP